MPADFDPARARPDEAEGGRAAAAWSSRPSTPMSSRSKTSSARRCCGYFDRLFDGRKLKILGYNRQRIPGNWKLMQENIKDPYHPGLLHTWFVTFGLWRADNQSRAADGRAPPPRRDDLDARQCRRRPSRCRRCRASRPTCKLHDPRFLDIVPEPWWGGPTAVMTTLFPSVIAAAAGQQRLDAPHPARRPRRVRLRVDALRLRRRRRGDDAAPPAPGQPVRPGGLRLGRRRRGDRVLADGLREQALGTARWSNSAVARSATPTTWSPRR